MQKNTCRCMFPFIFLASPCVAGNGTISGKCESAVLPCARFITCCQYSGRGGTFLRPNIWTYCAYVPSAAFSSWILRLYM